MKCSSGFDSAAEHPEVGSPNEWMKETQGNPWFRPAPVQAYGLAVCRPMGGPCEEASAVSADNLSLAIAPVRVGGDVVQTMPIEAVRSLEVSTGRTSRGKRYALVGGPAFGALSGIGQAIDPCDPEPAQMFLPDACGSVATAAHGRWNIEERKRCRVF
jgi:hypothetical protein